MPGSHLSILCPPGSHAGGRTKHHHKRSIARKVETMPPEQPTNQPPMTEEQRLELISSAYAERSGILAAFRQFRARLWGSSVSSREKSLSVTNLDQTIHWLKDDVAGLWESVGVLTKKIAEGSPVPQSIEELKAEAKGRSIPVKEVIKEKLDESIKELEELVIPQASNQAMGPGTKNPLPESLKA